MDQRSPHGSTACRHSNTAKQHIAVHISTGADTATIRSIQNLHASAQCLGANRTWNRELPFRWPKQAAQEIGALPSPNRGTLNDNRRLTCQWLRLTAQWGCRSAHWIVALAAQAPCHLPTPWHPLKLHQTHALSPARGTYCTAQNMDTTEGMHSSETAPAQDCCRGPRTNFISVHQAPFYKARKPHATGTVDSITVRWASCRMTTVYKQHSFLLVSPSPRLLV